MFVILFKELISYNNYLNPTEDGYGIAYPYADGSLLRGRLRVGRIRR